MKTKLLPLCLLLITASAHAELRPNPLFSDGAVLQAGVPVPVWGTGRDGEKVMVEIQGQMASTIVKNGRWKLELKPLKAGGPFSMTIEGDNKLNLTNILVGEVWLCSGQSNMAFQLGRADGPETIAAASDTLLRLYSVPRQPADEPTGEAAGQWLEASPSTASNFSAVAYFFGRDLRRARQTPVGLIESSVGGTPAEAWTSRETLEDDPELKKILERHAEAIKSYQAQNETKKAPSKKGSGKGKASTDPARTTKRPAGLYNGMIAPLQPFAIKGAIWYQGEANSGRALEYQRLFPALIKNWRTAWNNPGMPFFFVQIAPHVRMSPEIREAQLLTAQRVSRTGVVVTTDVGDAQDIHPKRKQPVGERLALCARAIAYGEAVEFSGPQLASLKFDASKAVLTFTNSAKGLVAKGGQLRGFTIAGVDGKFVPATATIDGATVIVSAPEVPKPAEVRYGWEAVPDVNLFNSAGLPASPFRSGDLKTL